MTGASPSRLARRLGTADAVVVGLVSMLGAGIFVAMAPAAEAAGSALLIGLLVAAVVAYCNARSSARLAARFPESGGTYVYARRLLSPTAGFAAGWAFVVGKLASCAALALTFGAAVAPSSARPVAAAAVVVLVALNYRGVHRTAQASWVLATLVVAALAIALVATFGGGELDVDNLDGLGEASAYGILQAAGIMFFAFAGYARIATLGEEIREPARSIPRAITISLATVLVLYAAACLGTLLVLGPEATSVAAIPLLVAVEAGSLNELGVVVRVGAAVASVGVLLALIAGVGRTTFAMAADGELPRRLSAVHERYKVPHVAELAVGVLTIVMVAVADLTTVVQFSAFTVLLYYAFTNISALRSPPGRVLPLVGLVGCLVLAFSLPWQEVVAGLAVMGAGLLGRHVRLRVGAT